MPDHRVPNLKAAVEMAESWRVAGTHIWFRGQNRLWPIATTLGRRQDSSEEIARVNRRLQQFCDWLRSVPELGFYWRRDTCMRCSPSSNITVWRLTTSTLRLTQRSPGSSQA